MAGRDDSKEEATARPGDVIAGKYEVVERLGAGGMGVVVAARHLQLGQMVAIKLLHPKATVDELSLGRFQREGKAAAALRSDHVARTLDIGTTEAGAPFLVMEYLEGNDLGKVLKIRGALPVEEAVGFVIEACEAMAEAHALGIIHRDLKPSNLFLAEHPSGARTVKVLDFGISKLTTSEPSEQDLTTTMATLGTPLYMSPEQMRSAKAVDARTDIWALGAILHELMAGAPPFKGESLPALCAAILSDPPTPLRSRRDDVPEALEQTIVRCLEKDPDRRPQQVSDLVEALRPFAPAAVRDISISRGRLPIAGASGQGASGANASTLPEPLGETASKASTARTLSNTTPKPRGKPALLAGGIVAAVAAVGLVVLLTRGQAPGPAAGAAPRPPEPGPPQPSAASVALGAAGASSVQQAASAAGDSSGKHAAGATSAPPVEPPGAPAGASSGHQAASAASAGPPAPRPQGGARPPTKPGRPADDPTKSRQF
jgi:eukaryotic-like serine/threonine-protein kinase